MNPYRLNLGNLAGRNERLYAYSNCGRQWSAVSKKGEWLAKTTKAEPWATVTASPNKPEGIAKP